MKKYQVLGEYRGKIEDLRVNIAENHSTYSVEKLLYNSSNSRVLTTPYLNKKTFSASPK